jgi:tetratricopeptide (TPR) repeat protein
MSSMPSNAASRPILGRGLRSLSLLRVVLGVGAGLALIERHQRSASGQLTGYTAGGIPQLRGDPLGGFADQALAVWPERAQPRILKAMALAEQGQLEDARIHLEEALSINRRDPLLLHLYASVLQALGEDPDAIVAVRAELKRYFPVDWERMRAAERASAGEPPRSQVR